MTFVLYYAPGACSRVTLNALEEIGEPYEARLVSFAAGEQRAPAYLKLNPKGKVPTLVVDGEPLTENAAILFYLSRRFPGARLLPVDEQDIVALRGLSDLIWCSGTLHPLLHRFFRSGAYVDGGEEAGVKAAALKALHDAAETIAARVADGRWWHGEDWSIVDTYLNWIFNGAKACGFARADYPALDDHSARVEARPAFTRALQREAGP